MSSVTLSAPERVKLKACLVEITNVLARVDAEKEVQKEITARIKSEFDIKPSQANKLARVMYKHNYADLQAEQDDFEYLYETLVEGKKTEDEE
jgi:PP-loop superfamily ATP-utilizing enzyme